ncbi:MAG: PEGA domain-containing protein, partial [Spirochaetaceae bacterium]|nr:PEGA domain-containing protein [Spirochaetaceae bacterium]
PVFSQGSARERFTPPERPVPVESRPGSPDPGFSSDTDLEVRVTPRPAKPADPVPPPELIVESSPSGAEVFLNNSYAGMTPFTLRSLPPGGYRLTLSKMQYKTASVFINLEPGQSFRLRARLLQSMGTLKVTVTPPDAEVWAGGARLLSAETELPVGPCAILIRRFGYREYTTTVQISDGAPAVIETDLENAPFQVEGFGVSRKSFNPSNPGLLGKTEFSFTVTAPGTARLSLVDSANREVFSRAFAPFTAWDQAFLWDGKDSAGKEIPDGSYRAVLECESEHGEKPPHAETAVEINRGLAIRYRNIQSGLTGLMYAPTVDVLPPWSFQISSGLLGRAVVWGEPDRKNFYLFQIGGAVGIPGDLEVIPTLSVGTKEEEGGWPNVSGSLGLKYPFLHAGDSPAFRLALTARGMLAARPSYGGSSQFPGFAPGLAAELRYGAFGLLFAPELLVSPYALERNVTTTEPSPHYAAILRCGLFYDLGVFQAGVSNAVSLALFPEKPGQRYPLFTGLEIHALIPDSFLNLSLFASWEHTGTANRSQRFLIGGGLGIVY